jgi:uncharacterized protein (DUF934 family)
MSLLDATGIIADAWRRLDETAPLPAGRDVILPFARLKADGPAVLSSGRRLGAHISNDTPLAELERWLDRLALIAIEFPSFADGRGFSLARRLRLRGFKGELRASGHVIAEQFAFVRASGFDTVEIDGELAARQPVAHWLKAAREIGFSYQRGYDGPLNILDARRRQRAGFRDAAN